jgi:leader peptidase (prepilin peptidase)/N-methyltransferase
VIFIATAGILGLVVGSFLNVVIHRLPIMLDREWRQQCSELAGEPAAPQAPYNLMVPRSACPGCGAQIRAIHNIPVLSFLALRGRCAACGHRISPRYPLVEAATGAVSALVAWHFGPTTECAGALLLCWTLIALTGIDLEHQLLPDILTLPLLWLGLAFALAGGADSGYRSLGNLQDGVIGAMAGYGVLWTFYQAFRLLTGKEGMGYGDFKLLGALGAWLGWQSLPVVILLASMVGSVTGIAIVVIRGRDRNLPIPFGPFLAGGGLIALLWGHDIVHAWRGASGL